MRRILSSIMLIAVAAMASVSCQKEENAPVNETKSATLTLHATVADTKTYIEANTVLWGTGEYVQLYFNDGTNSQYVKSNDTYADEWNESDQAMFAFGIEYTEAESYVLGGVYPASAVTSNDSSTDPAAYKVDLPATQDATATSYDPAAFIMIMKPETVANSDFDKDGHIAYFRRAAALNKITLKGLKETITSITITVPEDKYLAGRRYFDLTTGVEGEIYHAKSNSITVNGTYNAGDVNVWFTSWGVELAAGEKLTIKMTSATKTYTRTIEVREEGINFVEGGLNTLIVNMSSVDGVVLDNLAGEYLIVNADLTCAAQAWAGGNNLPQYDLTVEDGVVLESTGLENCKMTIELQSNGKYTIKDAKNYYLYAPSANSNYLKGLAEPSELTDWTIVKEGDKYVLTSSGNNSRNILRYNSTNTIFSCYGSGQGDVTLYKYSEIKPDTNPSITVEEGTEASIGAEGGNLTFTCTTKNLDGKTLEVDEESDYLTSSVAENVITITVAANETTESRTLNATIKCGSVVVPVTINQAGKPAEGTPTTVTDELVASLFAATNTTYADFSGVSVTSTAVYAGNSAKTNTGGIQLRSNNNNSGIVTTTSGGKAKTITVTWASGNMSGRTLDIYGKSTAYSAASDLYNSNSQGTKLGSIIEGTSTKLEITGDYEFIGLRSKSGAMYLTSIEITWETNSGSGSGETPDPDPEEPETPGTGGDTSGTIVLSEEFDNSTGSDSTVDIDETKFPNFSGATSKAYTSKYGGIKLGSGKAEGYITSKSLDLSSSFTVQIDACKYGSDTGNIVVTVGGQTKTIANSELGAAGTFKTFTLSFNAATATSTVKIATSSNRAYIDNVVITRY